MQPEAPDAEDADPAQQLLSRYRQLTRRVDAFFADVFERQREHMECATGCSDCCHVDLTLTSIEAAAIADALATTPRESGAKQNVAAARSARCVALGDDNRCKIYEHRPLVCRSHGIPVQVGQSDTDDRHHLPVIQVCPRNFQSGLDRVAPSDVLNQSTISTILGVLDAAYCDVSQTPKGARVSLREVIAHPECFRV